MVTRPPAKYKFIGGPLDAEVKEITGYKEWTYFSDGAYSDVFSPKTNHLWAPWEYPLGRFREYYSYIKSGNEYYYCENHWQIFSQGDKATGAAHILQKHDFCIPLAKGWAIAKI